MSLRGCVVRILLEHVADHFTILLVFQADSVVTEAAEVDSVVVEVATEVVEEVAVAEVLLEAVPELAVSFSPPARR